MKKLIKNILWRIYPKENGLNRITILSGPAKGVKMLLDLRLGGSYFLGIYDKWIFDKVKLETILKPGMVCWDCGAFYGYYSAVFRKLVGETGFVESFEASTQNYKALSHLAQVNNWNNLRTHHLAITQENSEIEFVNNFGAISGPFGNKVYSGKEVEYITVKSYGVDELIEKLGVRTPDLIKFDLETAEIFALMNGHKLFTQKRPVIMLELHGQKAMETACAFIKKYNYKCKDVKTLNQADAVEYHSGHELCDAMQSVPDMLLLYP